MLDARARCGRLSLTHSAAGLGVAAMLADADKIRALLTRRCTPAGEVAVGVDGAAIACRTAATAAGEAQPLEDSGGTGFYAEVPVGARAAVNEDARGAVQSIERDASGVGDDDLADQRDLVWGVTLEAKAKASQPGMAAASIRGLPEQHPVVALARPRQRPH
jgi:hypothetical protein